MSQKLRKTYLNYDVTHKKTESQNHEILFSLQTQRLAGSFEDLNRSLVQSVEELRGW